jgi:hypothetical protein
MTTSNASFYGNSTPYKKTPVQTPYLEPSEKILPAATSVTVSNRRGPRPCLGHSRICNKKTHTMSTRPANNQLTNTQSPRAINLTTLNLEHRQLFSHILGSLSNRIYQRRSQRAVEEEKAINGNSRVGKQNYFCTISARSRSPRDSKQGSPLLNKESSSHHYIGFSGRRSCFVTRNAACTQLKAKQESAIKDERSSRRRKIDGLTDGGVTFNSTRPTRAWRNICRCRRIHAQCNQVQRGKKLNSIRFVLFFVCIVCYARPTGTSRVSRFSRCKEDLEFCLCARQRKSFFRVLADAGFITLFCCMFPGAVCM